MRGEARGLRPIHLFWAFLLALPPVVRLLDDHLGLRGSASPGARLTSPSGEAVVLRQRLMEAEADLAALGVTVDRHSYGLLLGRVLPLNDPATARSSLFVALRSYVSMRDDVAVVSASHSLVGRAIDVFPPAPLLLATSQEKKNGEAAGDGDARRFAIVHVQTVLDREFRVRFSCGDAHGVLQGTGETASDGAPLLTTRLLQGAARLQAGDRVITDQNDEVYPAGLLIGTVIEGEALAQLKVRSRTFLVKADVNLRQPLDRVVLLPSLLRLSLLESPAGRSAR